MYVSFFLAVFLAQLACIFWHFSYLKFGEFFGFLFLFLFPVFRFVNLCFFWGGVLHRFSFLSFCALNLEWRILGNGYEELRCSAIYVVQLTFWGL